MSPHNEKRNAPPPAPATPQQALESLLAGNQAYVDQHHQENGAAGRGPGQESPGAPKQQPFAAVLGCSDARVPTEQVFNQSANQIFIVRVAGNVLGGECLGSLEYAATQLADHLRLMAVLGHSQCGAVTAAVDAFLQPDRYPDIASSQALRAVIDRILAPVRAASHALQDRFGGDVMQRPGSREALIELSVGMHAAFTAWTLQGELAHHLQDRVAIAFGVFDLASGHVWCPDAQQNAGERHGLAPAPADRQAFLSLAGQLSAGSRVGSLLAS